jgi:general secretion pathway protein N
MPMRVDSLSPRTWVLAGAAVWAIVVWGLALAGMGGRLGDTDAGNAAQRLPDTKLPVSARPGVMEQYAEIRSRPLFSENRRHQPFTIDASGEEGQANTFDYTLTSVVISGDVQLAILKPAAEGAQPVRVKLGTAVDTAPQWTLASLEPRAAVFRGPEGDRRLDLRVFNGVGGANPPPMNLSPQPAIVPDPTQPGQEVPGPQAAPVVPPPPPPPSGNVSTEVQLEAIRKRIEERRAQLRQQAAQEAQNAAPPGQTP